ncbi:MAG: hypothetical protein AABW84_00430, partial [Nanoarchaeota archaeon]
MESLLYYFYILKLEFIWLTKHYIPEKFESFNKLFDKPKISVVNKPKVQSEKFNLFNKQPIHHTPVKFDLFNTHKKTLLPKPKFTLPKYTLPKYKL